MCSCAAPTTSVRTRKSSPCTGRARSFASRGRCGSAACGSFAGAGTPARSHNRSFRRSATGVVCRGCRTWGYFRLAGRRSSRSVSSSSSRTIRPRTHAETAIPLFWQWCITASATLSDSGTLTAVVSRGADRLVVLYFIVHQSSVLARRVNKKSGIILTGHFRPTPAAGELLGRLAIRTGLTLRVIAPAGIRGR